MQTVFITGGTGYIGTRLIKALQQEGQYHIRTLVRKGSENKLPAGVEVIYGDALDASTYEQLIAPATTFVHLVGVAHPSPSKKEQFKTIDLISIRAAAKAAVTAGIQHFVYLSVAMHPTRIMKDFQAVRAAGEAILLQQNFAASFIRPWYVLGPGHWWPLLLKPVYWVMKLFPSSRTTAQNLDTVTIGQMIRTLVYCIQHPPALNDTYEVQDMKKDKGTLPGTW
ncbi:MAG: NAD(P)H-binding protein [Bacteroidetes bacterium]|nr:NAD(P)H-binding protein [Bacteroidota bacterium]